MRELQRNKVGSQISRTYGKCLTEEQEIVSRWTEHYSELNNYESNGDTAILNYSQLPEDDLQPIVRDEVQIAEAALKRVSLLKVMIYQQNLLKLARTKDHG